MGLSTRYALLFILPEIRLVLFVIVVVSKLRFCQLQSLVAGVVSEIRVVGY